MGSASTDAPIRGDGDGPSVLQLGQRCLPGNPSCCYAHFISKPFRGKI